MKKKIKKFFFGKNFFRFFIDTGIDVKKSKIFKILRKFKNIIYRVKNAKKHESDVKKIR